MAPRSELLIRQRLRALTRALPSAREGDVTSLHHARVASRRLREALPLVARKSSGRKLERVARRLTRALGPVRELDVALLALDEIDEARVVPRAGLDYVRQTVRDERTRVHADMVRRIERCNIAKLQKKAVASARKQDAAPVRERSPRQRAAATARMARRGEQLRAAIENAAGIYLPDRLHQVRIAVKKLRYAMELVRELSRSRSTARLGTLKRAQDVLGRMHDLEVLIARTRGLQGSPGAPSLKVSADLDRLVRELETECRQLHVRYMNLRKSLLAICEYATSADRDSSATAA